jgi:uncharacterized protein YndB with AHSA1/START domain
MNNITARVTHDYHASISEVWKALTDNNAIPKWMKGTKADSDWKEGSSIKLGRRMGREAFQSFRPCAHRA